MNFVPRNAIDSAPAWRKSEEGSVKIFMLVAVFFIVGVAVGIFSVHRMDHDATSGHATPQSGSLSEATRSILQRLDSPLQIRFYSSLDPASVSDTMRSFSGRVDQLVSEFEREANGKIKLVRYTSSSNPDGKLAASDGISFFNREKGAACFLGIAVARDEYKEVLPNLSPDWEQALESDLSRLIARVAAQQSTTETLVNAPPVNASAIEQVSRVIPDASAVSLEDGTRILREAALREFTAAAKEAQTRMSQAQQRLAAAQSGGSEAEQQGAMKQVQQAQIEQTEKIKEITARLQVQIAAFERLKGARRGAAK